MSLLLGEGRTQAVFPACPATLFIELLFPPVRAYLRPVSSTPWWRPWDVVYTARLSAACLVALSIELLFPPVRDFLFSPSTQYAEAFLGY